MLQHPKGLIVVAATMVCESEAQRRQRMSPLMRHYKDKPLQSYKTQPATGITCSVHHLLWTPHSIRLCGELNVCTRTASSQCYFLHETLLELKSSVLPDANRHDAAYSSYSC